MIGLFDSGNGGLTIYRTLRRAMPMRAFLYFGDHAHLPYGERSSEEVVRLTIAGVDTLFRQGCKLAIIACNTATAVAGATVQHMWLAQSGWRDKGHNALGIIAPTVEAATGVPWGVNHSKHAFATRKDLLAIFATTRTVASNVFPIEIGKRCPHIKVVQQAIPDLVAQLESGAAEAALDATVAKAVTALMAQTHSKVPTQVILGCTHYPLVEHLFRKHLPEGAQLMSQPDLVAAALENYLTRHPHYLSHEPGSSRFLTTGDVAQVRTVAARFLGEPIHFEKYP